MSNRKLYLNLKRSFTELFKTRAYYLKEMTSKWSIFEKPYLDQDYRGMHLEFSKPRWSSGRGALPLRATKRWTFQWSQGSCWIGAANPECDEEFGISAMIADVPPYELGAAAVFTATSSDPAHVWLVRQEQGMDAFATEFIFKTAEDWEGTVTICVKASLKGRLQKEFVASIPSNFVGNLRLEEAFNTKPVSEAKYSGIFSLEGSTRQAVSQGGSGPFSGASNLLNLQIAAQGGASSTGPFKTTFEGRTWDCGCNDIVVSCEACDDSGIAWDDATSADTIARGGTALVAITDSLAKGDRYSWSVSGTGFSLVYPTTVGLTNTLSADATACGLATITVTGCGGTSVTGYVRCTTGSWTVISTCSQNGGYSLNCISCTINQYRWTECAWCCNPATCGSDNSCCSAEWGCPLIGGRSPSVDCAYCPTLAVNKSTQMTVTKEEWGC